MMKGMVMITTLMELKDVKFDIDFKCQNIWYTCICIHTHTHIHRHTRIMFNLKKL